MVKSRWDANREEAGSNLLSVAGGSQISPTDWVGRTGTREADQGEAGPGGAETSLVRGDTLHAVFRLIHKINNHLQVITINAEMMEMMNGGSNRYISKIMDAAILIREQMDDFRDTHGRQRHRLQDAADALDLDDFGIG
jgi:hypothetical protein